MDGTASAGSSAQWSRGDHVHPSDTTKYNTSNPSGYQTAAQVTASARPLCADHFSVPVASVAGRRRSWTGRRRTLASGRHGREPHHQRRHPDRYQPLPGVEPLRLSDRRAGSRPASPATCPLTGGTLSGALHGTAATFSGAGSFRSTIQTTGYQSRQGVSGAYQGNFFNKAYTGSDTQLWVDTTNLGNITVSSDYRIKRDVIALPSMWEETKALRPVSYRHQDYIPAANAPIAGKAKYSTSRANPTAGRRRRRGAMGLASAHELQEALIADAATGVKDQANCIQSPNVMTIVATLTRTLQEAMERIEALEAQRG